MFDITILAIGKIKEPYFFEAANEYLKRLKPYAKIRIVELEPEPFNNSNKEKVRKIETEKLVSFLKKQEHARVFILSEHGKGMDSHEFAELLDKENNRTIFVFGGSLGFDRDILEKYQNRISLSPMTFPHEMARVVLLEQAYRAAMILKGKDYHY